MEELNLAVGTLFSEFRETVYGRHKIEVELYEHGTFAKKTVKGKVYWYLQRYVGGQAVQKYFGPSNTQNDKIVAQKRDDQQKQKKLIRRLIDSENKITVLLRRAGVPSLDSKTAAIIELLSASGSVLVGSHAFSAYCGMLGVLFEHNLLKTADVDIAFDNSIEILGKPVNILEAIRKIDPDFREIPGLSHRYPPHSFISPNGMRVDILAPLVGKPKPSIKIRNILGAAAEPLRFLDFLIKYPVKAVLIGPKGGIPVAVPDPVRYALHKLIISSYRSVSDASKSTKDLMQAQQLLEACLRERKADLLMAYKEVTRRGPKWKKLVLKNMPPSLAKIF